MWTFELWLPQPRKKNTGDREIKSLKAPSLSVNSQREVISNLLQTVFVF